MLLEGYFHVSMLRHTIIDCCFGVDSDGHIKVNVFIDKSLHECVRKQSAFLLMSRKNVYMCLMKRLVNIGPRL